MVSGYRCAGCGEWNETTVDESAGRRPRYVEDCQVCCRPISLSIQIDADGDPQVSATSENDV